MNKKIFIDGGTHFFEGVQQFLKIYNIDTNDIYVEWHHDNQWGHKFPKTYSVEDQQKYLHAKQQLIQLSKEGKIKYTEWY